MRLVIRLRYGDWMPLCLLAFACAGTQSAPPECPVVVPALPLVPQTAQSIAPADLAPLAVDPHRLISMVGSEGVGVARLLSCERDPIESLLHTCDDPQQVLAPVLPELQAQVRRWLTYDEESGVLCSGEEAVRCVLPPHNECESRFTLEFEAGALVRVSQRDDWQSVEEVRQENDTRVDEFFARQPSCADAP